MNLNIKQKRRGDISIGGDNMSQQEIMDFLKEAHKNDKSKWFNTREMSQQIGVSIGSITNSVRKLRSNQFVKWEPKTDWCPHTKEVKGWKYQYKK